MNNKMQRLLTNRSITFEQMRAFIFVAEHRSFHLAAGIIIRTQSAVTQSISKLENALGHRLIERGNGRFNRLTPEGERFLLVAKEIVGALADAVDRVNHPATYDRIMVGVPDDFEIPKLHGAISQCITTNPSVRIQVTSALSSQLHQLLDEEVVDIAILKRTCPAPDTKRQSRISERVLRSEPLHWVANESLDFDSLSEVPLVAFPLGCAYREAAAATLQASAKPSFFSYVSASYENIRVAISAGLGVGILPRSAIRSGLMVLAEEQGFPELPPVHLSLISKAQGTLSREFAGLLEDVFHSRTRPALAPAPALS